VSAFILSSSIGRDILIENILIRTKYKSFPWRSSTELETGVVVNSVPSVPYHQNLPDLRPFSLNITKNGDSHQFLVLGDENGLIS
jgi:hypothetical protein